ncbi:TetR family transcriptional regulator [Leucobacter sp. cx-42]|uniref:TetR/AcrR family transcriptional regulator n=1 Tax=unclassified Leucobacter TaxID=2621730 RepID=UPI00165E5F9A|nr:MULTISPECIES: TetR/AcrR family transcriptional regulator [unclassified Leucobacter]MBC9953296.1 TetR family transcriptional regulator [Leucobacter sp. cx-42]
MSAPVSRGRPQASTREVLAEAACELFLERGYDATSVTDLAKRVGVSRSSFFNYFDGKGAILWFALDERITHLLDALADDAGTLDDALGMFGTGAAPESLLIAIVNADAMGVGNELAQGRAVRQMRIADALVRKLRRTGVEGRKAEIIGAGIAGALLAAVWEWAKSGSARRGLDEVLAESLRIVREIFAGAI